MVGASRHVYWAHALEGLLQEIESNGYQVSVDDFNIRVHSLDLYEHSGIEMVNGKWVVE